MVSADNLSLAPCTSHVAPGLARHVRLLAVASMMTAYCTCVGA